MSRAFGPVPSTTWRATGTPAPSSYRPWRGCCVTRATPRRVGRSCWRRAACPTDRCTTTSRAAWKSSPPPHSTHRAPSSPTRSATHWTRHANAGEGLVRFLDIARGATTGEQCAGCPIAPTALESPIISPRLRAVAARCFDDWEALIATRLRADGWPDRAAPEAASAALALIEGALLLARVSGQPSHLAHAKRAVLALLAPPTHRTEGLNPERCDPVKAPLGAPARNREPRR